MKRSLAALLLAAVLTPAAHSADEGTIMGIESRQGIFEVIRMYFGPMLGMVRGQIPFDAAVVQHNATRIAQLAEMIPDGFRRNTADVDDVETEALDDIWDDIVDFNAKANTLAERASALAAASAEGLDATRKAFGGMGQACKGCHDNYREQN